MNTVLNKDPRSLPVFLLGLNSLVDGIVTIFFKVSVQEKVKQGLP